MSLNITSRPEEYSPVNNPVIYKFQREDYDTIYIGGPGPETLVTVGGVDMSTETVVGDAIYFKSDNGVYDAAGEVVAISYSAPDTVILTSIPFISGGMVNGFVNLIGGRPLYRVEIEVWDNYLGVKFGITSKSPNNKGLIYGDVSAYLKSVLYRDWLPSTENENGIAAREFYIKYQEAYYGSSSSQVDDSSSLRTAVLASLQVKNNADLSPYVLGHATKKILTMFDSPSMWRGYPFSLSMINDQADYTTRIREYDASDNLILEYGKPLLQSNLVRTYLDEPNDQTKTILFDVVSGAVLVTDSATWTEPSPFSGGSNFDSKVDNIFVVNPMAANVEYSAEQAAAIPIGVKPSTLYVQIDVVVAVGRTVILQFVFLDASHGNTGSFVQKDYTVSSSESLELDFDELPIAAAYFAVIAVQIGSSGGINSAQIIIPKDQVLAFASPTPRSETKTIQVKDPCDNPVYLFWKNTLGGDSFWLFDDNQDLSIDTDNERKAKQLICFANNISVSEFLAINEVNTPGQIYRPVIQELTTDVNKTSARTDQQLYVIDRDGGKTGVINLTQRNSTQTKQRKHSIDVTIEYPEIFL